MKKLNLKNLTESGDKKYQLKYDRKKITPSILHFGVGNFHRAHQAVYADQLLCQGENDWGIIGVSLRSKNMRDILKEQDFLYTQVTMSKNSNTRPETRIIGAIQNILVASEQPEEIISTIANQDIQLITTTITEKGYFIKDNTIDFSNCDISLEKQSLAQPSTIYGFLAAGIIQRYKQNSGPMTILCCDNIQGGGNHLKQGIFALIEIHAPECKDWIQHNISFCSSMVDRVSPATDQSLKQFVNNQTELIDNWPVSAESFSQWVIEDNFLGARPPFDKVGAQFVENIEPYEKVKLRFLNAGHSIAAIFGFLIHTQYVHQSLENNNIYNFTKYTLIQNVIPATTIPTDIDAMNYINQVINRFENSALPYPNLQVGTDSSIKIQQRWFPTIDSALRLKTPIQYMAFALAAWIVYIQEAIKKEVLNDPLKEKFSKLIKNKPLEDTTAHINNFLKLTSAEKHLFFNTSIFIQLVTKNYTCIEKIGFNDALKKFLQDNMKGGR